MGEINIDEIINGIDLNKIIKGENLNKVTKELKPGLDNLHQFIDRIERLEEEKKSIMADIKEIYAEASTHSLDSKTIKKIIQIRRMDQDDLKEQEEILKLYKEALGMKVEK
jgi:uncharacterized protein (UPF0335 family)